MTGDPLLDRYRRARIWAVDRWPYLAPGLYSLVPAFTPAVRTAGVSREGVLYLNPGWTQRLTVPQLGAILVHELSPLLRRHYERARHPPERWKAACDLEINDDPELARWLPPGGLTPGRCGFPRGLLAEQYHALLEGAPCLLEAELELSSGTTGAPQPYETLSGPLKPEDLDRIAAAVKEEIRRAGNAPGGWLRWAREAPASPGTLSRITGVLAKLPARRVPSGRPHRRSSFYAPVLVPRLRPAPPEVWIVIDTSASMSPEELEAARKAANRLLARLGTPAHVVEADARIQRVRRTRKLGRGFYGGGGTDLVEAVALALSRSPHAVVVITDGEMRRWPPPDPRVVYVLTKTAKVPGGRRAIVLTPTGVR